MQQRSRFTDPLKAACTTSMIPKLNQRIPQFTHRVLIDCYGEPRDLSLNAPCLGESKAVLYCLAILERCGRCTVDLKVPLGDSLKIETKASGRLTVVMRMDHGNASDHPNWQGTRSSQFRSKLLSNKNQLNHHDIHIHSYRAVLKSPYPSRYIPHRSVLIGIDLVAHQRYFRANRLHETFQGHVQLYLNINAMCVISPQYHCDI